MFLWRWTVRLFAIVGLLFTVLVGLVIAAFFHADSLMKPEAPPQILLTLDLRDGLSTGPADGEQFDSLFGDLVGRPLSLGEVIRLLDLAAADDRVVGLIARFGGDTLQPAAGQELGDAIGRLRAAGVPTLAYATSFGEFGPGTLSYALAAQFDRVAMHPLGSLGLTGLRLEQPYAGALLEQWQIDLQVIRHGDYKTTLDGFTEAGMTPANRDMMSALADSLFAQAVGRIAAGRALEPAAIRRLVDGGPYAAGEAASLDLVDRLADWQDLLDSPAEATWQDAGLMAVAEYGPVAPEASPAAEGPLVAHLRARGPISERSGGGGRGFDGDGIAGEDLAGDIDAAVVSGRYDALILSIDSLGGSTIGSELVRRALARAQEAGLPVVVAMGNVAASGGYWIASGASRIVAQPGTLTGSIGVIAANPDLGPLFERFGIRWDGVQRGAHAGIFSSARAYSPAERARMESLVAGLYDAFIDRVADARRLDRTAVLEIAEGRVWTGEQAADLGLVDALGGAETALAETLDLLDLPPGTNATLEPWPGPEDWFQQVRDLARWFQAGGDSLAALGPLLGQLRTFMTPIHQGARAEWHPPSF